MTNQEYPNMHKIVRKLKEIIKLIKNMDGREYDMFNSMWPSFSKFIFDYENILRKRENIE
jgi:hypothetical protein